MTKLTSKKIRNLTISSAGKCREEEDGEKGREKGEGEKSERERVRKHIVNETKDVVTHSSIAFSG